MYAGIYSAPLALTVIGIEGPFVGESQCLDAIHDWSGKVSNRPPCQDLLRGRIKAFEDAWGGVIGPTKILSL